jgi:hypothetical protein
MFSNEAEVGIAVQSAKGTAAANPKVVMPVTQGLPEWRQADEPTNPAHQRLVPQFIRKHGVWWEADFTSVAFPASVGAYLKALLGGESYATNVHTLTPNTTLDRWVSLFAKRPGPLYERFSDGLIESVQVSWRSGEPVNVAVRAIGLVPEVQASAYTPNFTDTDLTNFLIYIDSTVTVSWAGEAAANIAGYVEGGTVTIQRPLTLVNSYRSQTPMWLTRHVLSVTCSLDLWWQDYAAYRAAYTGSTSGSTASDTPVYGSLLAHFGDVKETTNRSLDINVPNLRWKVESLSPDPTRGQPLRGQVVGAAVRSASELVTCTARNAMGAAY